MHKLIILKRFIFCFFFLGLLYGQQDITTESPFTVTFTPSKTNYKIGERLEYEIRIDNVSDKSYRIPVDLHFYFVRGIGPDGKEIKTEDAILAADYFDERNTIELKPECFMGQKSSWLYLESPGTYTCYIDYYMPRNRNTDTLFFLWKEKIKSNVVTINVR